MQLQWKGASVDAKELIEAFEAEGWTFTLSKRNHALGRAPRPSSMTVSIPQKLGPNRSKQNAQATLRRFIQERDVDSLGHIAEAYLKDERRDPVVDGILETAMERKVDRLIETATVVPQPTRNTRRHDGKARGVRPTGTPAAVPGGGMPEATESAGTMPEALPDAADVRRPVDAPPTGTVRLGEPSMEARGGLPAGSRPAWSSDGALCGWLWPTGAGVGVRRRGRPATGITPGEAVLPGPFPLPGDVPLVSSEVGRQDCEPSPDLTLGDPEERMSEPLTDTQIVERIRRLVGGRDPETEEALRNALATIDRMSEVQHAFEDRVARLVAERDEQRARAEQLQSDLDTWLSLAPRPNAG